MLEEQSEQSESDESDGDDEVTRPSSRGFQKDVHPVARIRIG